MSKQIKSRFKIQKTGFSLIELLVGITIGGIILTVVMGSYAAMTKTNLKLDAARQLQKETNFAVIRMADKIRNYKIDSCEETKLVLKDRNNNDIEFQFLLNNKKEAQMQGQSLFSANISVDRGSFECTGVGQNSTNKSPANFKVQPRVQIYLKVSSRKNPKITNWVRTTISSRIYD